MNISSLAKIMLADVWERLQGMRVGGKSRSSCPLRGAGGSDWTTVLMERSGVVSIVSGQSSQVLEFNQNNFR